ncbi:MAG: type I-C CRISPR-associated endonuclease Cas1c [Spirochaeta sp.]|jgi:CRISPR-associated protein Cas1|nr:type I-C CRISPR-associated endonuclease Cas1c [Spirochaeta sp.]
MKRLLNTLYVGTQGSYLRKEGETLVVEQESEKVLQVPIHGLGGLVCFGNVLCSPFLLGFCAERDISVSFMSQYGRFLACVRGPVSGNVLLRRQQYRLVDEERVSRDVSANIVTAKMANSRSVISRTLRDYRERVAEPQLSDASRESARYLKQTENASTTDEIRGLEGVAAAQYFRVFDQSIIDQKQDFRFRERSRRPPLDEVNALLSFVYTLLAHDVRSALETVGLDPAVGFLHRDRPGRPGLALDLMEEFRAPIADRLVLSLINRRQVKAAGFERARNGAVVMDDSTRKTLLTEYQNRKQTEVYHPYIGEKVPVGLLFFVQANLLARFIRGDIDGFPPYFLM